VHSEPPAEKVMSGGGVMASPRCLEKSPKELKLRRESSGRLVQSTCLAQRIAIQTNALRPRSVELAAARELAVR